MAPRHFLDAMLTMTQLRMVSFKVYITYDYLKRMKRDGLAQTALGTRKHLSESIIS